MLGELVALLASTLNVPVYGGELPTAAAADMPARAIVVRPSGGAGGAGGYAPIEYVDVDTYVHGATLLDALDLDGQMFRLLIAMPPTGKMRSVRVVSGPQMMRDERADWPQVQRTYQVLVVG